MIERANSPSKRPARRRFREFVPKALARGRDMLIMSVGGLLGHEEWFRQAREKGCRIYVPSGAIAGLDGIKSASIGRIESAVLTSRKPVAALRGSKYVVDRGSAARQLQGRTVIFEGSPKRPLARFPQPPTSPLRCASPSTPSLRFRCASA